MNKKFQYAVLLVIFTTLVGVMLPTAFAQERITLTTYYPSPFGQYDRLRLVPRTVAPPCDANSFGLLFFDETTMTLMVCGDFGSGPDWNPPGEGIWQRDAALEDVYLQNINDFIGIGTNTPEFKLTIDSQGGTNDGGIIAKGWRGSGQVLTTAGAGTRLIWYPRKVAFRVGEVQNTEWNDINVGVWSTVTGGLGNRASGSSSAISGGNLNTASGNRSFIGGGAGHTASGIESVVGGGNANTASDFAASVLGGSSNTASADYSTVSGGNSNVASGNFSTVAGGRANTASGESSFVSGDANIAGGDYSFSSGRNMQLSSNADRTFVWGYSAAALPLNNPDYFLIFPNGSLTPPRVGIGTATPSTTFHVLGSTRLEGAVNIVNGTQGAGKVLTSDAAGLATWQNASGGPGDSVMYLRRYGVCSFPAPAPAACPAGWSQADYQVEASGDNNCQSNFVRTCYRTDRACQVMYLRRDAVCSFPAPAPAACPAGWSQADYQVQSNGGDSNCDANFVRTCYRCN